MYSLYFFTARKVGLLLRKPQKIESFEMWVYRLKNLMDDRVSNQEVLHRMSEAMKVLPIIQRRKFELLGHISRNSKYELLQLVMQGKFMRKELGRRRLSWLRNLRD